MLAKMHRKWLFLSEELQRGFSPYSGDSFAAFVLL